MRNLKGMNLIFKKQVKHSNNIPNDLGRLFKEIIDPDITLSREAGT